MTIYRLPFGHAEWPDQAARTPAAFPHAERRRERTSRILLRLPETLKRRVEASAELEGVEPSAWIVRALSRSVDPRLTTL